MFRYVQACCCLSLEQLLVHALLVTVTPVPPKVLPARIEPCGSRGGRMGEGSMRREDAQVVQACGPRGGRAGAKQLGRVGRCDPGTWVTWLEGGAQAEKELGDGWTLMRSGTPACPEIPDWLAEHIPEGGRVGIDPFLHTVLYCAPPLSAVPAISPIIFSIMSSPPFSFLPCSPAPSLPLSHPLARYTLPSVSPVPQAQLFHPVSQNVSRNSKPDHLRIGRWNSLIMFIHTCKCRKEACVRYHTLF